MANQKVVVFTENNARVLTNPDNIEHYRAMDNCLIDPNLDEVRLIPPQYWTVKDGTVVRMSFRELLARARHIRDNGVVNSFELPPELIKEVEVYTPTPTVIQRIWSWLKNLF